MSGELLNYSIERQRHECFVGREALLTRFDQLLTVDGADRWVAAVAATATVIVAGDVSGTIWFLDGRRGR
jgi:hypothetical protein